MMPIEVSRKIIIAKNIRTNKVSLVGEIQYIIYYNNNFGGKIAQILFKNIGMFPEIFQDESANIGPEYRKNMIYLNIVLELLLLDHIFRERFDKLL